MLNVVIELLIWKYIKFDLVLSCSKTFGITTYNLLNVAELNNTGHKLEFHNRKVKIYDDDRNMVGTREQTKGNLFYLDPIVDICLFAKVEDVWLWHIGNVVLTLRT